MSVKTCPDLAHGCTSRGRRRASGRTTSWMRRAWAARVTAVLVVRSRAGMCPHGEDQGQWTVVRRRLAARSRANRPSCQGVR